MFFEIKVTNVIVYEQIALKTDRLLLTRECYVMLRLLLSGFPMEFRNFILWKVTMNALLKRVGIE